MVARDLVEMIDRKPDPATWTIREWKIVWIYERVTKVSFWSL
jgi:hypothetical protein